MTAAEHPRREGERWVLSSRGDMREAATQVCALAERKVSGLSFDDTRRNEDRTGGVNSDVIALSQRFAMLMAEYQQSMEDGKITVNEAKRLLKETTMLQQVLIDMKLNLEEERV